GGSTFSGDYDAYAEADISWDQDFIITGASGNGFVQFQLDGNSIFQGERIDLNLWGMEYPGGQFIGPFSPLLPITFGVPYGLAMTGFGSCVGFDVECADVTAYVSYLQFFDASGNPLSGMSLIAMPEPSAEVLLATGLGLVFLTRRKTLRRFL